MDRYTLRRLLVLGLLVASLTVISLGIVAWREGKIVIVTPGTPEAPGKELPQIRAMLRDPKTRRSQEAWDGAEHRLRGWMTRHIIKGRTTKEDVIGWFGTDFQDLDRPLRDRVQTLEYQLTDDGPPDFFVWFDFDPRTGIVQDWNISASVCGWCPHVLVNDGRWRLEGKMLAGRLGLVREGSDTLLLPRLLLRNQRLRIRLANWAPEVEYLDEVRLGLVACAQGYEVDIDREGKPYVWKELNMLQPEARREQDGSDAWTLSAGEPGAARVMVLEARNTSEFERVMRIAISTPGARWPPADLALGFDNGSSQHLQPLGTKFLRRVVVPVPATARTLHISAPSQMWFLRRAWLGQGQAAQNVTWLPATDASETGADVLRLLRDRDGHRLILVPRGQVDLGFIVPPEISDNLHRRFVLRLWGYYELLPSAVNVRPARDIVEKW